MASLRDKESAPINKIESPPEQDDPAPAVAGAGAAETPEASEADLAPERRDAAEAPARAQTATADDRPSTKEIIETLRRYHLGDPAAAARTDLAAADLLPALLHPYRDASKIRYEYPVYLHPAGDADSDRLAEPLAQFLAGVVDGFASGPEAARILRDNLPWLERYVRRALAKGDAPVAAAALLSEGAEALEEHLGLDPANRERLQAHLDALIDAVAPGGRFLGYGPKAAVHLFLHAVTHRMHRLRQRFAEQIEERIHGLRTLLGVERAKTPAGDAETRGTSLGSATRYFDPSALSGVLVHRSRGSILMSAERRQRITQVLETLQAYRDDPVLVRFVGELDDACCGDPPVCEVIRSTEPCAKAAEVYDREAVRFAKVFAAARIARLEVDGRYDPAVHDSWFESFDWQAFSDEELKLVTTIVALAPADHVAGEGLRACSRLLVSGKPVQVLVWARPFENPGATSAEDPLQSFRFELAYFGVGHRQVFVAQCSAARQEHVLSGYLSALDSGRTGLHLIDRGPDSSEKPPLLEPWIVAGAALESRAHPFIQVDPAAGDNAADRVRFGGNPAPERDWPADSFSGRDERGQVVETDLAFTFADYALLVPQLREQFRVVPAACETEDLIPAHAYLARRPDAVDHSMPYVWATGADGVSRKLVVSRRLMIAARDRQNTWRALQELAGVRNRYVDLAIERVREQERAAATAEREQLASRHELELERVRSEAAGEVMGRLVDVLLGSDLSSLAGPAVSAPGRAVPAPVVPGPAAEPAPATPVEAEDEVSFDDPWIDSLLCTSCDDCMGVNKLMFAYNENKQATIVDPRKGTYAQLVEAAEICPARCIHPGKPLNPDEPNLDELVKRAAPYN